MSTIVVAQKNGRACIAADSLTTFGETRQSAEFVSDWDKIIRFGDTSHIGIVGSAAHHLVILNIIENHTPYPLPEGAAEILREIVIEFDKEQGLKK